MPDIELYVALKPGLRACQTQMLVAISSPYRRSGLLFQKFKDHFGKDGDETLFIKAPTLLLNPTIAPTIIAKAYEARSRHRPPVNGEESFATISPTMLRMTRFRLAFRSA